MRITYNNQSLPFVKTEDASFETVYSDDGADYLYTRFSITVTSTLSPEIPGLLRAGETMQAAVRRIAHALEQPRKPLKVESGGRVLVEVRDAPDAANGPKPEFLSITRVDGDYAYIVRFKVTTCFQECDGQNPANKPKFLSNRWRESVDIAGDDFRTRRTRTGKLVCRSDMPFTADSFRWVVTPPIPEGFIRVSASYEVQSDGLALAYTFVDEEQYALPPAPATHADGQFFVTMVNAAKMSAECTVKLKGDVKASKRALVETAIAVCMSRLERAGPIKLKGRWMLSGTMSERLYHNEINVTLRCILSPRLKAHELIDRVGGGFLGGLTGGGFVPVPITRPTDRKPGDKPEANGDADIPKGLASFGFDKKPFRSEDGIARPPDMGLRATAGLRLAAAALNDPCLAVAVAELRANPNVASAPATDQVRELRGTAVRPARVNVVDLLADLDREPADVGLSGGVWTDYRIRRYRVKDHHKAVMSEQRDKGLTHVVPLAAPTTTLRVEWTAERVGEPPVVPRADLGDDNLVILREEDDGGSVDVAEDGVTLVFSHHGVYEYAFLDPEKCHVGAFVPPWVAELVGRQPVPTVINGPDVFNECGVAELVGNAARPRLEWWEKEFRNWASGE